MIGVVVGALAFLAVVAAFVITLGGMAWLATRLRRRRSSDSATDSLEEMWHQGDARSAAGNEAYEEHPEPPSNPGDRPD